MATRKRNAHLTQHSHIKLHHCFVEHKFTMAITKHKTELPMGLLMVFMWFRKTALPCHGDFEHNAQSVYNVILT